MDRGTRANQEPLEFKARSGFQLVFGAVLALLGTFFLAFSGVMLREAHGPGPIIFTSLFALIGAVMFLLGAACLLVRKITRVDPTLRTVTTQWRFLIWHRENAPESISDQAEVRLNCFSTSAHGGTRTGGGGRPEYHVSLCEPGRDETPVATHPDFATARRLAEDLAARLSLPLVDVSTPRRVVRWLRRPISPTGRAE